MNTEGSPVPMNTEGSPVPMNTEGLPVPMNTEGLPAAMFDEGSPAAMDESGEEVVAIVGLRCAGKSVVGEHLARRLGVPFADLDRELAADWARAEGLTAAPEAGEVLERIGEPAFRALEERTLARVIAAGGPLVLATGGGCVESRASRERLAEETTTVWLRVEAEELQRRMRADPTLRPALSGDDPVAEVPALSERRAPLYRSVARHVVDGGEATPDSLAERIEALLAAGGSKSSRTRL